MLIDKDLIIKKAIQDALATKQKLLESPQFVSMVKKVSEEIINAFKHDKKVLLCGNGGSAADAQHIAAEFSGKFYLDREPLFAEALHVNTSFLTAVANDYSYGQVYSRMVKAMGREGDVLIGISTSGNSENVIEALKIANNKKMVTVGFCGEGGGGMKEICNYLLEVPSNDTPRIQESHILIGHIIAEITEKELFG